MAGFSLRKFSPETRRAGRLIAVCGALAQCACGPSDGGTGGSSATTSANSSSGGGGSSTGTGAGTSTTSVSGGPFTITAYLSPEIATVGIVEWSASVPIESAYLEFGRDASAFEFRAPIEDPALANQRTLMLGMKEEQVYSARIVAQSGGDEITSPTFTLETGVLPNGLPQISVNDIDPARLFGGFTVTCNGFQNAKNAGLGGPGGGSTYAFIFDADGDMVWAYDTTSTIAHSCSTARFSFDGKYLWMGNFSNVDTDGALMRVTLDGLESRSYDLPARHHHFAVLPDNSILFQEQANGGGYDPGGGEGEDLIKRLDPETGEATLLYDENTDFEAQITESGAHTNYLTYIPHLEAISFSMRHTSTIGLMKYPEMELMAVFGGPANVNTFGISWNAQHGHNFFGDRLLIFNNNNGQPSSYVLDFQYDLGASTAVEVSRYDGGQSSAAFGEVQHLSNGNMVVTYSVTGVFHEVSPAGELLREVTCSNPLAYGQRRKTLYGPPPPFAD